MALDGLLLGWINLKATFSEVQLCSQAAAITSRTPCCKEVFDDVTVIIIIVKVILERSHFDQMEKRFLEITLSVFFR